MVTAHKLRGEGECSFLQNRGTGKTVSSE